MRYVNSVKELADLLKVPVEDLELMRELGAPLANEGGIDFVSLIAWLVIKEGGTNVGKDAT